MGKYLESGMHCEPMKEIRTETVETETEIVKTHHYADGRKGISRIPKRSAEKQARYEKELKNAMSNMGIAVMESREKQKKEKGET